jgi:hypothetical protein
MSTETPFHQDMRRILGDTEYEIVCAKAAILDRLMERLHGAFVEDTRRYYLSPDAAPPTATPAPEQIVEPAVEPTQAPATLPESPADEADALPPAAPVRRGRGRPRKATAPEAEAVPADEAQADEAPAAADGVSDAPTTVEDLYGAGDDFLDGIS